MKRTGFKRKITSKPLKTTKLAKVGKQPISKIQKVLWVECRRVATILYPPVEGKTYCYTCSKPVEGRNRQLGHFLAKSVCGAFLKYDIRNLRWQCYHCNINLGGNGPEFYKLLAEKEGQKYVDKLFEDKKKTIKAYDHYVQLLEEYKKITLAI